MVSDERDLHRLVTEVGSERNLVDRLRQELDSRRWSQTYLANKLQECAAEGYGKPIHQGVLSKLIRGDEGRHISIDQMIALARVLNVPVAELLVPRDAAALEEGWRAFMEAVEIQNQIRALTERYQDVVLRAKTQVEQSPSLRARVESYLQQATRKLNADLRDSYRGDGVEPVPGEILRSVEDNATPAVIAARDVLETPEVATRRWLRKHGITLRNGRDQT